MSWQTSICQATQPSLVGSGRATLPCACAPRAWLWRLCSGGVPWLPAPATQKQRQWQALTRLSRGLPDRCLIEEPVLPSHDIMVPEPRFTRPHLGSKWKSLSTRKIQGLQGRYQSGGPWPGVLSPACSTHCHPGDNCSCCDVTRKGLAPRGHESVAVSSPTSPDHMKHSQATPHTQ